jgi:hypothetical protein
MSQITADGDLRAWLRSIEARVAALETPSTDALAQARAEGFAAGVEAADLWLCGQGMQDVGEALHRALAKAEGETAPICAPCHPCGAMTWWDCCGPFDFDAGRAF